MTEIARTIDRQRRQDGLIGFSLLLPLLLYLGVFLAGPLASMLVQSVYEPSISRDLPDTAAALSDWSPDRPVPQAAVDALVREGVQLLKRERIGEVADRLDFEVPGGGGLLTLTLRRLALDVPRRWEIGTLSAVDPRWGEPDIWAAIKRGEHALTFTFFIRALDHRVNAHGELVAAIPGQYPHLSLLWKTLWLGGMITVLTLLLAYPMSYFIAGLRPKTARLIVYVLVMSLWLSLLVRASAWIVLLQSRGLVNDLLIALGILGPDDRVQLVYNLTGLIIAMVHFMLPSMILPLLAVMRRVPKSQMRAAQSLGAKPWVAFLNVYLPMTLPGVAVAVLFGYIQAIGFYIIPALLGGSDGQLISTLIAAYTTSTLNYGLASAIGALLLIAVLVLYLVYSRLTSGADISLGNGADIAIVTGNTAPPPRTRSAQIAYAALCAGSTLILIFLIAPVLVIIPLSFGQSAFFTFTPEMWQGDGWSLRWYEAVLSDPRWRTAFSNSFIIATSSMIVASVLGGLAALGLSRPTTPARGLIAALFLSPLIVPIVLFATGTFLLFSKLGLVGTMVGLVLAHVALISPAVVFNVRASLAGSGFDLLRAAASLGSPPMRTFLSITLPIAAPGFAAGALFAFLGSFDETVIVQFLTFSPDQFTFPRQMFSGVRDEMNPTVLAAGCLVMALFSTLYFFAQIAESLRQRRSQAT
ncbi:Putrescine transport system permease protein PotH [Tsuneonella dongtanensis]|uniref:Putrescine transport system permease protein PotH n=1 Tax=Tsuneonella dongtanensis TaxID=692370 RepID=A0A1B2A911_9SPHN|nr:ABC transporter permease subunit [Tsuneonella dongtanensis]ANY18649.1 Putrescine transport system permease protein PotH [Tsuneonella dongtanensis]